MDIQIPNKVKIGPHMFEVQLVEVVNKSEPRRAEINMLNNCIRIDSTMVVSKQEEGFFHEVFHEISTSLGVELEENDVMRLSYGIYMVLKDNDLLK